MSSYQDHLLFGAVTVLVFVFVADHLLSYGPDMLLVATAFILLAALFPDIDHAGSVVHRQTRAAIALLTAGITAFFLMPSPLLMMGGAAVAIAIVFLAFRIGKPRHRGITHTVRFGLVFALVLATVSALFFDTVLPGVFAFLAYLSHIVLDRTP